MCRQDFEGLLWASFIGARGRVGRTVWGTTKAVIIPAGSLSS